MITFDKDGNPQPAGIINYTFEEFETTFVANIENSKRRPLIFENYQRYLSDFKEIITPKFKNWVNGSFTTLKSEPNDIDIVNIVDYSNNLNQKEYLLNAFLTGGGSKDNYLVDAYFVPVYPSDDPRYKFVTEIQIEYWSKWFGHDRNQKTKAIIEITID